jgi:hypothetical protein
MGTPALRASATVDDAMLRAACEGFAGGRDLPCGRPGFDLFYLPSYCRVRRRVCWKLYRSVHRVERKTGGTRLCGDKLDWV